MRAIVLEQYGPPDVLVARDVSEPEPGPGQVLIEVELTNITYVETQIRAGTMWPEPERLPFVPGNGVGGVIEAVGTGVDPKLVGRRVVSSTGGQGAYAERVVVAADQPYAVPDELDLDVAVALLADGRTATMLIGAAAPSAGERVLVEAAAGGVGTLLVQLARQAGARVIGAAGGGRKVKVVRGLGAETVLDYREPDWPDRVRAAVGGLDLVFDGVGGSIGRTAFQLLEPGGRLVGYGLASGAPAEVDEQLAAERGIGLLRPTPSPDELRSYTEHALAEGAAGRLRPVIGQRFPLESAADAHAAIESRATVGKTLLEVR